MSTVSLATSAAESDALEAIERHHAELVGGLAARTAGLLAAVRGNGWQQDRDVLVEWCQAELVPHADAEDAVLYPAARELGQLEPLVRAMSHEHARLGDLVVRLRSADDAPVALVHAGALQALFETHVAKENDLLLPALASAHETSVAGLVAEMQAMLEPLDEDGMAATTMAEHDLPAAEADRSERHTCGCHDEAGASPELDARTIPHAIRHATIFGALAAVEPAADLVLVAPHDPLPLLAQLEQRAPAVFDVEYLQRGPDAWRLRFTRMPAEPVGRAGGEPQRSWS